MTTKVIRLDDFRGGEFGRLGPAKAPKNSFTATNMLVTQEGLLCVRPGWEETTPTGVATGAVELVWTEGDSVDDTGDPNFRYAQGGSVRTFQPNVTDAAGRAVTTKSGTYSGFANDIYTDANGDEYLVTGTTTYNVSGNVTALTGAPGGVSITRYGERLVVGDADSNIGSVEYSAAADFNSWPGNIFTLPQSPALLRTQRAHLVLAAEGLGWYVLTGALTDDAASATLRKASSDRGPILPSGCVLRDDLAWFASGIEGYPTVFDGARTKSIERLGGPLIMDAEFQRAVPMRGRDQSGVALFATGTSAASGTVRQTVMLFMNGVWTKHVFEFEDFSQDTVPLVDSHQGIFSYDGNTQQDQLRVTTVFTWCDGGGASVAPKFYSWSPDMNRPGSDSAGDELSFWHAPERAGDDSSVLVSGDVSFPYMSAEQGEEWCVRQVIVDGVAWDLGASNTNHFDIHVDSLRSYSAIGTRSSETLSWDHEGSEFDEGGTPFREEFSFGDQGFGGQFQLHLENCRGIAIESITVVVDSRPARWA